MATSPDEILAALQDGIRAINSLNANLVSHGGNGFSFALGDAGATGITAINSLSTTAISVIDANDDRSFILFHNPSSGVTVYVAPTLTSTGGVLTLNATSPGGAFRIIPMDYIQFSGGTQAWQAVSSSGSGNPLTIASF